MSLDLVDIRFKLPADLNAVLDAIAESQGREKSVVTREFVEAALTKQLRIHCLIHSELKAIGMESLLEDRRGISGRK